MTISDADRAVGPLVLGAIDGAEPTRETAELLEAGAIGGFTLFRRNISGDLDLLRRQNVALHTASPRALIVAIDQEGGRVARLRESPVVQLPSARELGDRMSERALVALGRDVAKQLVALGFTINFAPVLDLHSEEKNPIIGDRAFGSTVAETIPKVLAFARGLREAGLGTCGKHFPGHGATLADSHFELPYIDEPLHVLMAREFSPFREAAAAGFDAFMSAHVVYRAIDDKPATMSHAIATELLRKTMGFAGVLFSDDLHMKAIAGTPEEAAVAAIAAGCDSVLVCENEAQVRSVIARLASEYAASEAFRVRCTEARQRVDSLATRCPAKAATDAPMLGAILRQAEQTAVRVLWGAEPS